MIWVFNNLTVPPIVEHVGVSNNLLVQQFCKAYLKF